MKTPFFSEQQKHFVLRENQVENRNAYENPENP